MPKIALLIVDMQNAYFNSEELEKQRENLVGAINALTDVARKCDVPVFNIRTSHERNRATWTLNMLDDGQGFLFDGEEVANVPGLVVDGATVIFKTRDSSFYDTNLGSMLGVLGVETLIITGVSTHTCVFQTASDAYAANFRVVLASDAIATHEPRFHDQVLELIKGEYRQEVLSNADILDILARP